MENLNSPFGTENPEAPAVNAFTEKTQEVVLRVLAAEAALAGVFFLVITALNLSQGTDILLLVTGGIDLVCSVFILFSRKVPQSGRAQILALLFLALVQVFFVRFGWSGQSLLPWVIYMIAVSILVDTKVTRIWEGVGVISLLVWFLLASAGQVPRLIVITQNSILLDAGLVLITGLFSIVLIGILRRALSSALLDQLKVQEESRTKLIEAQAKVTEIETHLAENRSAESLVRKMNSILDPAQLIQTSAELIKETFDLYYVGVFLIDPAHEYAVLRYGTGAEGRRMVANRHRLAVGGYSMIGWTTQTHQSRLALDVGEEAVHFDNPDLPETRSELSLPLQTENGILGALTIQSSESNAFSQHQVDLLQQLVDTLAVALERANAFDQTRLTLEEIRVLNRAFVQQTWGDRLGASGNLNFAYENPKGVTVEGQSSTVKVPLTLRNEVIGNINLEIEGDQLQADQMEFLQAISSQITSALENARLLEETQRAAAQEQKLNQISSQFSRAQTIDEILRTAVAEFGKLPTVTEASISLVPPDEFDSNYRPGVEPEVNL